MSGAGGALPPDATRLPSHAAIEPSSDLAVNLFSVAAHAAVAAANTFEILRCNDPAQGDVLAGRFLLVCLDRLPANAAMLAANACKCTFVLVTAPAQADILAVRALLVSFVSVAAH